MGAERSGAVVKRVPEISTERARALRSAATPAERTLWRYLRGGEAKFTRQFPIGPFIADFACRSARLVVELDGRSHDATADYDARRDAYLRTAGWRVLRFSNQQVMESPDGVAFAAKAAAKGDGTHPQPLPEEGGEQKGPLTRTSPHPAP